MKERKVGIGFLVFIASRGLTGVTEDVENKIIQCTTYGPTGAAARVKQQEA
jgi:hypothetical protein